MTYKDELWTMFRCSANRMSIVDYVNYKISQLQGEDGIEDQLLDEYETYYSDIYDTEDYIKLQSQMGPTPDIMKTLDQIYHKSRKESLTWYDQFQKILIQLYLRQSSVENKDFNIFSEMIEFLKKSIDESSGLEMMHRLQFSANYLIVLRAQGRIADDPTVLMAYNYVI